MIPARAASKRVKNKNIRLLSGKPLISYVIETALKTGLPVYVNTDCKLVLEIARKKGCFLYERDKKLASDNSTNDDFMLDFMQNIKSDAVLQILPTSPFITLEEINSFLKMMKKFDTTISVKNAQIGCVYKNKPINFDKLKPNPPSQEMEPVKVYATSLMGWKSDTFIRNMKNISSAYHGGEGSIGYFTPQRMVYY